jgi:hypothetical protein
MKGWSWQFGTLFIAIGISLWMAWANIHAALDSGASDTLAYSIIADAILLLFGAAFWHFHGIGRNMGCVAIGTVWLMAAAYVSAANVAKLQGAFQDSWAPVRASEAREAERLHQIDVSLEGQRAALKLAQDASINAPKMSIREGAEKKVAGLNSTINTLIEQRSKAPPDVARPSVKHFLMGWEPAVPIGLLIAAQVALWATFRSEPGGAAIPPLPRYRATEPAHQNGSEGQGGPGVAQVGGPQVAQGGPPLKTNEKKVAQGGPKKPGGPPHGPLPENVVPIRPTTEQLVRAMVAQKKSQRAISVALGISRTTVQRTIKQIETEAKEAVKQ